MDVRDKIFIGGAWVPSAGSGSIEVLDSSTEQPLGSVPDGTAEDVDRAVAAARAAFPSWSATSRDERLRLLTKAGELLAERRGARSAHLSGGGHAARALSVRIQVGLPLGVFASLKHVVEEITWEERIGNSLVDLLSPSASWVRSPRGTTPSTSCRSGASTAIAAGLHRRAEALRGRSPQRLPSSPRSSRRRACPRASSTSSWGADPVRGRGHGGPPGRRRHLLHGLDPRWARCHGPWRPRPSSEWAWKLGGKSANIILDDADLARAVPTRCGHVLHPTRARPAPPTPG